MDEAMEGNRDGEHARDGPYGITGGVICPQCENQYGRHGEEAKRDDGNPAESFCKFHVSIFLYWERFFE